MPVFINEVVVTAEVSEATGPGPAAAPLPPAVPLTGADRDRLVDEVAAEVFRRLERSLDRLTER